MQEVTVQVSMTVMVEDESKAEETVKRWLPYVKELPLYCSDGASLTSVVINSSGGV